MDSNALQVIVLAAGKGTRLKSDLPKVLHPLFNQPLLARALNSLALLSVERTHIVVGHGKEQLKTAIARMSYAYPIQLVLQEPQLGTGHAVIQVQPEIPADFRGNVLVTYGDVPLLREETLKAFVESHQASQNHLSLLVATVDNPAGYGRVLLQSGQAGQVEKIVEEKDASPEQKQVKTVNTGIYCLRWQAIAPLLNQISSQNAQGEFYLTDVVAIAVQQGLQVGTVVLNDPDEMLGVNSRTDLAVCHQILNQRAQERLMAQGVSFINPCATVVAPEVEIGADTVVYPGCYLEGAIQIGPGCMIGPHTTLLGEVSVGSQTSVMHSYIKDSVIGSHTTVGPFAHIRDGSALSDHVRIGNFVEVKNTQIDHHSNAAHLAYLGDATLGSQVNMGAGSITANYDPIRNEKHRTVIEDGVKVGCNSVLVAPLTVQHHACIAAGSVITHPVAPWDLAIARPKQTHIPQWVSRVQGTSSTPVS